MSESSVSHHWPFGDMRPLSAELIVADPPWLFGLYSDKGEKKSPQAQYACMALDDIKALPVGHLARSDCWLFLWVTAPLLPEGIETMRAWGFRYVTTVAWRKVTKNGKRAMGPGYVARSMHENALVGAVGSPAYGPALPSIFDGVRREHSRKPNEFYELIDRFAPQAWKVDLFSRESRPGWLTWGNQATKFDGAAA